MLMGSKAKIVGVISMDLITVDVTKISNVEIGSDVELWEIKMPVKLLPKMQAPFRMNYW